MRFPFCDGLAHFVFEVVTLIDADDAAERAGDVVEELLSDFESNAELRHVGREGAA